MSTPQISPFRPTRRSLLQLFGSAAALGLVDPLRAANLLAPDPTRLSWLAHRTAGAEGAWNLEIDGELPAELRGTMFRTAPGESERFGVTFNHLFDGDAFVSGWSFEDGKAWLRARYVDTEERREEQEAGEMLFSEFGTRAPGDDRIAYKNQPSVNIIPWGDRLLGLSEGGCPTAIDLETLAFQERWRFEGSLAPNVSFTAHPRFDPKTGVGYAYGIVQGPGMALVIWRMDPESGRLRRLHMLPQPGYFMIHDVLFSGEHLVFVIPPVTYDVGKLMSGSATPGQAAGFDAKRPMRLLVARCDGTGEPFEIELPPGMVFHHGNAWEEEGRIVCDTLLSPDGSVLDQLMSWSKEKLPDSEDARLTRLVVDLDKQELVSRTELAESVEFPRFDSRKAGRKTRWLHTAEFAAGDDPFLSNVLVSHDLDDGARSLRTRAAKDEVFGEPVFVPRDPADLDGDERDGWLLQMGYAAGKDRSFLDVRDARTHDRLARVHAPTHIPLGFHGNFVAGRLVARA